ncbi:hypothetical protein [Nocardioides fonticola]|uniref:hypothetical protein n=1 Tax=Nocardioides fonticola TaxID=450363 RepID=UPI0031E11F1E
MRRFRAWARASNDRAISNARAAAIECARRGVERREVELYLERRSADGRGVASVTRRRA